MCHQTNLRFYNDIAYDKQYKGLILDGYEGNSSYSLLCQVTSAQCLRVFNADAATTAYLPTDYLQGMLTGTMPLPCGQTCKPL